MNEIAGKNKSHTKSFSTSSEDDTYHKKKQDQDDKRFRMLAEAAFEGLLIHSDGFVADINSRVTEITGYSRNEIIGKNILDFVDPAFHDIIRQKIRTPYEIEVIDKSGNRLPVEVMARPFADEGQVVVAIRDISEKKQVKRYLQESEERFKAIAETTQVGIGVVSIPDNKFIYVNDSYANAFGYSREELLKMNSPDIFCDSRDREIINERLNTAGIVNNYEVKLKRKDGSFLWALSSVKPVFFGGYKALLGSFIDITERKNIEEALLKSKQEWVNTFDIIPDLIAIFDNDHKIVRANKAMLNKMALSGQQAEGLNCFKCVHGKVAPPSLCHHSIMLKDCREHLSDVFEMNLGRDYLVSTTPVFDKNKKVIGSVHVARDISERRQSEQKLQEAQHKLNIALENAKIGVWEWDIATDKVKWDERMDRIFGAEPGTFKGSFKDFESYLNEEDVAHVRRALNRSLEIDYPFETAYRLKSINGETTYISSKAIVNRDKNGIPVSMTGVCFDVSGMKKDTEQIISNLNVELLRSNQELERFAYVASHDLQEPLRMISSYTQLLAKRYQDKLDQDANDFIGFATDGAARMQILINDLLSYSRIGTRGKVFAEIDLQNTLGQALSILKINISEKHALITNDDLPVVKADDNQMLQLFQNLIGNALKFSSSNPLIHIGVKEEKEHYMISVSDNGIGIEPQYFEKIFQIFQRLHTREEFAGTGIGLAICKRIVERHGGRIWVESESGKGTTFYFTIRK
jgi:PAS domain S-box-containing protein